MNPYNPHRQKTAGPIRYTCSVLFMLFSFCYLYFLQGEILAEAQYVYSHGITTYNLLIGAIVISLVLQVVQWIASLVSPLPPRWHALTYLPSFLLLAIITDVNKETIDHFTFGAWLWIFPLALLLYAALVLIVKHLDAKHDTPAHDLRTQLYPNYILLLLLIIIVGSIPQTTDVYHYELKTERLILNHDYQAASQVGQQSLRASARLTQLRMYALSKQGLLAERLFEYPQYWGSQGLLDVNDAQPSYRLPVSSICNHLGARSGSTIHTTRRYYELMLADSLWNQHTADYYLCSLLLDKNLQEFQRQLPRYYDLATPHSYDRLPKAYREALLLVGNSAEAQQGRLVVGTDTLAILTDTPLIQQFRAYNQTKAQTSDPVERINKTHRLFGKTYWWYDDYSDCATGELKRKQ